MKEVVLLNYVYLRLGDFVSHNTSLCTKKIPIFSWGLPVGLRPSRSDNVFSIKNDFHGNITYQPKYTITPPLSWKYRCENWVWNRLKLGDCTWTFGLHTPDDLEVHSYRIIAQFWPTWKRNSLALIATLNNATIEQLIKNSDCLIAGLRETCFLLFFTFAIVHSLPAKHRPSRCLQIDQSTKELMFETLQLLQKLYNNVSANTKQIVSTQIFKRLKWLSKLWYSMM